MERETAWMECANWNLIRFTLFPFYFVTKNGLLFHENWLMDWNIFLKFFLWSFSSAELKKISQSLKNWREQKNYCKHMRVTQPLICPPYTHRHTSVGYLFIIIILLLFHSMTYTCGFFNTHYIFCLHYLNYLTTWPREKPFEWKIVIFFFARSCLEETFLCLFCSFFFTHIPKKAHTKKGLHRTISWNIHLCTIYRYE